MHVVCVCNTRCCCTSWSHCNVTIYVFAAMWKSMKSIFSSQTPLCLLCTSIFKCLYSCGCILSFCVVLWNEHFVLKAHTATQILYRLAASLCFKQLIPHSNSAQPQPAWFIAETVTSIRINSHICAPHPQTTPTPPAATLTPFKNWNSGIATFLHPPLFLPPSWRRAQMWLYGMIIVTDRNQNILAFCSNTQWQVYFNQHYADFAWTFA